MRNITFLLLLFVGLTATLSAQEVSSTQWTQIQKKTADWCPNCGSWGWDFKEDLIETYADEPVLIWSTHYSGGLMNPTSVALASNYSGNGQPLFFADGANLFVSPNNTAEKKTLIQQTVDLNSSFPAFYGVGVDATYDGSILSVTAKAELFEASGASPLHLGLYLVRKETVSNQAGRGSSAVHKNLVINHFTADVFGDQLVESNGAAGSVYTVTGELEMPGEDMANYRVVPVLWSKIGDDYQFLNSNPLEEISISSSTVESFLNETNIKVTTISNNLVNVNINTAKEYDNTVITLMDAVGRVMSSQTSTLVEGENNVEVPTTNLNSGMYIINLQVEGQSISTQFYMN